MGGFFDGVVGFFSAIFTSIVNTVKALFTLDFTALLFEPLRPICYLLGITDRDITSGSASLVKIFHKSEFPDTRVRLIAEKARNDTGLLDMYWGYSYTGQNQYDKYYYYAQSNFMDHFPEGNIGSSGIDSTVIINALKDDIGQSHVLIDSINYGVPSNYVWAQWYLQENKGYSYTSETVIIDDIVYELVNATYDMDINRVKAYLTALSTIHIVEIKRTIVTIEPLDETTDKRTEIIKKEITKSTNDGRTIDSTVQVLSTVVTDIPKDSEENHEIVETLSDTTESLNNSNIIMDIVPPRHEDFYQVVYSITGSGKGYKLWLCSVNDSRYSLSDPDQKIEKAIELFPIVALRNSKVDVPDAENNSNCTVSFRRPGRYAQSKEMLQQIGIPIDKLIEEYHKNKSINDVYDVFFIVGISPKQTMDDWDDDPQGNGFSRQCIAKFLYETVDYIYRCLPCIKTGQTYYVTFSEEPLKGGVYWAGVPPINKEGKKCDLYDVAMDLGTTRLSRFKVRKLKKYIGKRTRYISLEQGYDEEEVFDYECDEYEIFIEGTPTYRAIVDEVNLAVPIGSCETTLDDYIDPLPAYQIAYNDNMVPRGTPSPVYGNTAFKETDDLSGEVNTIFTGQSSTIDNLILDYQIDINEYRRIVLRDMHSVAFTDEVDQGLVSVSKVSEEGFFMPLAVKALEQLNLYDKNKLVSEAFYMMFFAKKTDHLKFYQTPEFATFIKIVGICIIIIVQIFTWWTGPATSLTLTAVLMSVLKMIVIAVALTLAIHLIQTFVKDPMLKMALTAAAMIAAMYAGGGFSNMDFSTILQLVEIPCKMIEMYVGDQMKALQQEYGEFQSGAERTMQEMTEKKAALDTGLETEDIVQLQSATRMAGIPSISIDSWFFLSTNITPVDYVYDQYNQIYDYDSKFDLAF